MLRIRTSHMAAVAVVALLAGCGRGDTVAYDGLYARTVRSSMTTIERSTGRRFLRPPKLQERTRDELRAYLEQAFNEQTPALELAGIEGAYKRFGLLPKDFDLRDKLMQLLTEQVVGYYDPKAKVLYVMRDAPKEFIGTTITH
jgi:hypothetical protein